MGGNRTWTADELDYLAEKWGVIRPAKIGEKLGRSEGAVVQKASKLGLGPFLEAGGYVSLNQLLIAVTGTNAAYSYKMKSWVENRGLPVHTKRYRKNSWRVVYLDEFWKWAEKNKAFLDFSKMEPLALGAEPDWVAEQRRRDTRSNAVQRKDVWTPAEDDRLKLLLRQQRYSWSEIAHELNRSAGAIQRRINDLGLKDRPVRADNHNPWSDQDFQTMADMLREGYSYGQIADAVGRSEKAVRGRVYDTYWTENADKVREMLKDGPWGYGKPEPTVWQAKNKYAVKKLLGRFDTLLRIRLNQLGYEPYWQKEMCLHWDDVKGCTAGEADCDSCVSFKRIPPQFCVRCGATFFERESHKVCVRCRKIRRWQAMKKNKSLTHKAEREGEDTQMYFGDTVNTSPYFRGEAGAKIDDPRGKAVKFSSGQLVLGTAADAVVGIVPVTNDQALEQGDPVDIVWKDMTLALAGGTIAAGDVLACDANGALVKASADGGTIGVAMEAAASGQYFHMIVERGTFTAAG